MDLVICHYLEHYHKHECFNAEMLNIWIWPCLLSTFAGVEGKGHAVEVISETSEGDRYFADVPCPKEVVSSSVTQRLYSEALMCIL